MPACKKGREHAGLQKGREDAGLQKGREHAGLQRGREDAGLQANRLSKLKGEEGTNPLRLRCKECSVQIRHVELREEASLLVY